MLELFGAASQPSGDKSPRHRGVVLGKKKAPNQSGRFFEDAASGEAV
ncbi:hypothetical protein GKKCFE_03285 [Pseudomonas sp. E141]